MGSNLSPIPASFKLFTGFAKLYDRYRPAPPEVLGPILLQYSQSAIPRLVIDIGCGTGLSTRYWAERSSQVIGVDESIDMLHQAQAHTDSAHVLYQLGLGQCTGIVKSQADVVTCSDALRCMEPAPTLDEVARLLRPGGVFAAYNHDFYPVLPGWRDEIAYRAFRQQAIALDEKYGTTAQLGKWHPSEHLSVMQGSGYFRFSHEFMVHQEVMGNAKRLVGLALSYGFVQVLLKAVFTETDLGLDKLVSEAYRILGDNLKPWYWSTQVCLGVV